MSRRPDLFIIGAAKCGTTTLYEWLKLHPEVFMSPAKEPRYFAPDRYSGAGHDLLYERDLDRYLALFDGATTEKRLGEASVRYLNSTEAPRLIHQFQPRPYLVLMIRDPVERIHSLYNTRVQNMREPAADFEAALAGDFPYLERARIAPQLDRWLATFSRARLHVIVLEDMISEPVQELRRVFEFLDVDPSFQPPSFAARNVSHAPRSRLLNSITKSRPAQWVIWRALPRTLGESSTRRLVRGVRTSALNQRRTTRRPLSPEMRLRLRNELAPDVARLSELLGRDMATFWWERRDPALAAMANAVAADSD